MDHQDANVVAGLPYRQAVLAAASTLLVAYTNSSIVGLAFLFLFFAWGLLYIRRHTTSAAIRVGGTVWGALAGGAAALLLGQIILQIIYAAGNAGWATDPNTRQVLQLFGLTKANSAKRIILVIAAPAFALAASLLELRRGQTPQHGPPPPQEALLGPTALERTSSSFSAHLTVVRAASYSNAGILAGIALALAALAWPSLLSLPYLLILAGAVLIWSVTASSSAGSQSMRMLQVYTSVHLLLLYMWQIDLIRRIMWQGASKCLGLYHMHQGEPADLLAAQVVHMGALHMLFASLAFMAAGRESHTPRLPASRGALQHTGPLEAFSALWHYNERQNGPNDGLRDPLLGYGDPYGTELAPDASRHATTPAASIASRGVTSISRLLSLILPFTAGALLHALEGFCRQPHLPAIALVGLALLQASAISAVGLVIGLGALLVPSTTKRHPLLASSRWLCPAVLLWHLACYTATAVTAVAGAPSLASSIGLLTFTQGSAATLHLLAQVTVAMVLAAASRADLHASDPDHASRHDATIPTAVEPMGAVPTLHDSIADYWHHGRRHSQTSGPSDATQNHDSDSAVAAEPASERHSGSSRDGGLSPIRTRVGQPAPPNQPPASLDDLTPVGQGTPQLSPDFTSPRASPWPALQLALARAVYYLGFLALPAVLLWVGLSSQDLLHGAYLALLLIWFLSHSLSLEPSVGMGAIGNAQHWVLRTWASVHLLVMYVAVVTWLPGLPALLHPPIARGVMTALGTWHPDVVRNMLPVLLALVLATFHARLCSWLQQQQQQRHVPILMSPTAHPTLVLLFGKAAVSFGALAVVLVGYILVLWGCEVGLLGLGYLALLLGVFTYPPIKGRWSHLEEGGIEPDSTRPSSAFGSSTGRSVKGSSPLRWLPLAVLAVYAALDCLLQYALAATDAASLIHIPPGVISFIRDVVGVSPDVQGGRLGVRLLRSVLTLGAIHLLRFGFAIGTAQAHVEGNTDTDALERQASFGCLLKRLFILHSSKLMALAVFWAAMQQPGAIGWLLILGLVLLSPLLGRSATAPQHQQRLMLLAMVALDSITSLWMLLQYAYEVDWLKGFLGGNDSILVKAMLWGGIQDVPSRAGPLEAALRSKCILLLAVTLKRRAVRWLFELPSEVRKAAGPGCACCLFWPPADAAGRRSTGTSHGVWQRAKQLPFVHYVNLAAKESAAKLNKNMTRVLKAVDWPERRKVKRPHSHHHHDLHQDHQHDEDPSSSSLHGQGNLDAVTPQGQSQKKRSGARAEAWRAQLRLFQLAAIDQTERLWQNWGLELTMFSLLVAAFLATNILSLAYMGMIATGMAARPGPRRRAWRFFFVPMLGVILIFQYTVLVGLPPPFKRHPFAGWLSSHHHSHSHSGHHGHRHKQHQTFKAWFGLSYVDLAALWSLFVAFGASIVQVHYDIWRHPADVQARQPGRHSTSLVRRLLPQTLQDAYADGVAHLSRAADGQGHQEGAVGGAASQTIWMPMEYDAQPRWRWLDWARFYFYRHYSDAVLVAVIALCTLENDVIHAGYLALALYFFRHRESLRTPALFRWLPLYNFGVMLLSLAYQAPLQQLWHGDPHRQGCNLAHILGLYKMTSKTGLAFSLTAAGSIADVVLWAIARLQMRMYGSATFQKAMQVMAQEQAAAAAAAAVQREAHKKRQVSKALEASRLRADRATRVAKLKAGVSRTGGSFGVNSALLELDKEADDRDSELMLLGGSTSSGSDPDLPSLDMPEGGTHTRTDSQQRADPPLGPYEGVQEQGGNSAGARTQAHRPSQQSWWRWMAAWTQRADEESYMCYSLFVLIFVLDFSLLTMLFPFSLAAYALATQKPSRRYWQASLVYLELILIAQYIFQIPTHLHCRAISETTEAYAYILGLHSRVLRAVPIFIVYLATLMHVYALARQQEPPSQSASTVGATGNSPGTGQPNRDLELGTAAAGRSPSSAPANMTKQGWWQRAQQGLFRTWQSFRGFLLAVCSQRERPLHFIKIQFASPPGSTGELSQQEGQLLEQSVQAILDDCRAKHVTAAEHRIALGSSAAAQEQLDQVEIPLTEPKPDDSPPPEVDLARIAPLKVTLEEVVDEGKGAGLLAAVLQVIPERVLAPPQKGLPTPIRSLRPAQDAASVLQHYIEANPSRRITDQDSESIRNPQHEEADETVQQQHASGPGAQTTIDQPGGAEASGLSENSPDSEPSGAFFDAASQSQPGSRSSLASTATTSSFQTAQSADNSHRRESGDASNRGDNSGTDGEAEERRSSQRRRRGAGLASVLGSPSPPRQSRFARFVSSAAAATGLNDGQGSAQQEDSSSVEPSQTDLQDKTKSEDQPMTRDSGLSSSSQDPQQDPQQLKLGSIEPHWRTETDYYAATVALDFLSFAFVALFYQSVMSSAQSLSDITDERVVPVDYLGVLILLFLFMVLDRLFYTLGLHIGKAMLLWLQMALFYYYTFSLFWSPSSSRAARNQLRLLMLMKAASFALSALQLRSGYPPRASFRGEGGRHAFIFMRHVNTWGYLGLQVFCGLPFMYELRAVLDWSCTPTTLKLFDWLKLEDISTSLYFVTCDRYGREGRQLGDRQPRYMKFCQGTLLFLGLLVLLWVPLIVFSSGNPTYKVPEVEGFYLNASIGSMASGDMGDFQARMTFPLFLGGERQLQRKWVGNGTLPAGMGDQYTDDQLELLCVSEDSDRLWRLTPPAQKALAALLDDSSAAMSFSWSVLRNAPPLSPHGSPLCQATQTFQLAPLTREHLVDILEGRRTSASLMVANLTDPEREGPGKGGFRGLYSLFWQLRGDMCGVRTDFRFQSPGWGRGNNQEQWHSQYVGCNISLADSDRRDVWWQLQCQVLDDHDEPVDNSQQGWSTCNQGGFTGPRVVAVLERVQTGFLGQTLSSFGITGLYITFVFGIGRFLRLAATNSRMRIMYEDLPTTKRLIALCQDIYIARAQGELALEEELYWALINIYRSPAVMFELTKKKEV